MLSSRVLRLVSFNPCSTRVAQSTWGISLNLWGYPLGCLICSLPLHFLGRVPARLPCHSFPSCSQLRGSVRVFCGCDSERDRGPRCHVCEGWISCCVVSSAGSQSLPPGPGRTQAQAPPGREQALCPKCGPCLKTCIKVSSTLLEARPIPERDTPECETPASPISVLTVLSSTPAVSPSIRAVRRGAGEDPAPPY